MHRSFQKTRWASEKMRSPVTVGTVLLIVALTQTLAVKESPTVNVYTQQPVEYGQKNTLICHCSNFHPPLINIVLKKNGEPIPNCGESDLSFQEDWKYFITKYVGFIPETGAVYECDVTHDNGKTHTYRLEIF